jgi:hypothetical protein
VHAPQRPQHAGRLLRALAAWAGQQQELNAVIKLPLNDLEEQVGVCVCACFGRPQGAYMLACVHACMHAPCLLLLGAVLAAPCMPVQEHT